MEILEDARPYIVVLRELHNVVHACFGYDLREGWEEHINCFKAAYKNLRSKTGKPVSVTTKVHWIVDHVPDYCKKHNHGLALGSEQALESSHSKTGDFLDRRRIAGKGKPQHFDQLRSGVCEWNALRM